MLAGTRADSLRIEHYIMGTLIEFSIVGAIPGVAVLYAAGRNGAGTGRLMQSGTRLQWRAPGSATFGLAVQCTSDGTYLLADGEDRDKWIRVQVYASYLPAGANETLVYIHAAYGGLYVDITAGEAAGSWEKTYELDLHNVSGIILSDVRVWVEPGGSVTGISDDDVTYVLPTSEDDANVLIYDALPASDTATLHVRIAGTGSAASPDVKNEIHVAFNGL